MNNLLSKQEIATRLLVARKNKTRREVAQECNISISALAMYETGKRVPRDEIKVKLANCLGLPIEQLFFYHE